jgi:hypothetical protein
MTGQLMSNEAPPEAETEAERVQRAEEEFLAAREAWRRERDAQARNDSEQQQEQ